MASGHLGQICLRDGDQRLQDRVHVQTPDNVEGVVDGYSEEPLSKRGPRKRTPVHVGQESHQRNSGVTRHTRFLLPDFPSSQGIGRLETNPEPQGVQQIRSAPFLSDGDTANSHGLPGGGGPTKAEHLRTFEGLQPIRNVGDLYRFKRRLLSRGRGARAHQIPPVRLQRQGLRVSGAPLRSVDGSQRLYADRKGHRGLPQNSRGRHAPVPRRLVDEESVEIVGRAPPRLDAFLGGQTGIPRERGKISTRPHSDSGLPGFDPGPPEYARVPERKENPQGYPPGGLFAGENCPAGKDLAEVSRTLVQPPRVGPHGGSPHTADPTDAPRPVGAGLRQPLRAHLSERGNPRRVRMVGVAGQPSGGSTLPASRSDYVDCDGCLKGGLGRPPWRLGGLRALVKSLGQATHQLARALSGLANPEAFPTSVAGHCCGCHFRQYHHGCLYQQGGRDSVPVSVPLGTGRLGMVQATRDLSCGQPPVGRQERPRGRPVPRDPPSSDGVDPPQRGDQCDISALAHTACGPVRVGEEPQVASVLLNSAVPVIERGERPDAELGLPLRVRVPTDSPHTESAAEAEASADSPDPPGSPVLAQPAVVSPDDVDVDGSSEGDLSEGRPPEERGHRDEVPQTGGDEVDCMASVRKSFVDRGFSANVADTAARARRESTRRVYGSRLKHYQRWCVDRGVDPVKAPLTEVAEFLENLRTVRHKGNPLAPSTFAGYRSAIHQGFSDGSTVSSNTDLSTLLKGIFVVTAKPRTLKETWDLPTVLRYLAGPPFEPLATAPLKSVAVKTAFLIQLASARRVSWVHSCRIDPSHLRWENGGVRLLPSLLLDKNQSSSFTPSSVFLLSLKEHSPDDKVHCPLRALKWYLKLTEPLRGAEKALFIISKEPYKKASKGTVAGWVKEAISGAYSHLSREQREQMGIRAHDTRGVATTWAATMGVPFEEIMDAAAWSRPQTFARFYLKDLPAMRGRFSRAVMVAAGTAARN